ncbi:hypothetical protein I552_10067 [Mycobacterium xenopi 3993]|nr:hypothetical protein I552_10067 [Mycobacterium xenopi 3993]
MPSTRWHTRVDSADWEAIAAHVNDYGGALLPRLLTRAEAARLRTLYAHDKLFRATVDMGRHRYGAGNIGTSASRIPSRSRA